ncbi:MAG: CBS domain-containing protein [Chloroflexota bacterium]
MNVVPVNSPRLVGELMTATPVVVPADAPLADAGRLMEQNGFSGLPVIDADGVLVGVISESDLLRARATEHLWANWSTLRVRNLMTSPALTIRTGDALVAAAHKMERHHVSRLVVVGDTDETRPVGVLSISDLVRAMITASEAADGPVAANEAGTPEETAPVVVADLDEAAGD